ncbi:hypothetical protein F5Y03DRAFT_262214 [Xylaria venustula]|nr:hypothetical protein F5Y03DRAFT_262214 [Xylaria venustula]
MAQLSAIYWLPPALMIGAWLGGILIALGHHLYYFHLDGTAADVNQQILGVEITSQQFTNAVGTSFTFIVRALLVYASTIAYLQLFWRAARQPTKQNTLGDLDSMFSVLSNLFNLGRVSVWLKQPLLLLVALVSWLLPIAFVLPPGTLSVILITDHYSTLHIVPNLDFTRFDYVADLSLTSTSPPYGVFAYNGPSIEVQKIASAVAAQGNILPITPPAENSSWSLSFYGPSLSCGPMDVSVQAQVEPNIAAWLWTNPFLSNVTGYSNGPNCLLYPAIYLCWSPFANISEPLGTEPIVTPFVNNNTLAALLNPPLTSDYQFIKDFPVGPFTPLYMALLPGIEENPCGSTLSDYRPPFTHIDNATFFQCDLHNASYNVEFTFQSGVQSITQSVDRLNAVATVAYVLGPDPTSNSTCDLLLADLPPPGADPCGFDSSLLPRLSYTAIVDAFSQTMSGSVSRDKDLESLNVNSNIFSTILTDTMQLQYLSPRPEGYNKSLPDIFNAYNNTYSSELSNWAKSMQSAPQLSLTRAMEEIFSNLTISLMSSDALQ